MFKAVLLVCAQVFFVQSIAGQCIGAYGMGPLATPYGIAGPLAGPLGTCGCGVAAIPASSGGGLEIASASAIPPRGVSVLSENAIAGDLAVAGALPFLGTVALEGVLPTAGAGAVNYACGNGAVAILAEDAAPALAGPLGYGTLGYGLGPIAAVDAIGPLGCGLGPIAAVDAIGPLGYGIGPLTGPYRAGCGYGALI